MRLAGFVGLLFALVIGVLSISEFATLQTSLEALTSGPLSVFIGKFTWLIILAVLLIALALFASAAKLISKR